MKTLFALGALASSLAPTISTRSTTCQDDLRCDVGPVGGSSNNLIDEERILDNPRYVLNDVRICQADIFDYTGNQRDGICDPISYGGAKPFAQSLSMLGTKGWDNRCNSYQKAAKIRFNFHDNHYRDNSHDEYYYLYYNTGRASSEPRDYAFVAIMPGRKPDGSLNVSHLAMNYQYAQHGLHDRLAPRIFGKTLTFEDLQSYRGGNGFEALRHGAHIAGDYMLAGTKHAANIDDAKGDYLLGINHSTINHPDTDDYNWIQGNGILKGVARDLANWIYFSINTLH